MDGYSKGRTYGILITLIASIIYEVKMVDFLTGYFDATFKVVIAAVIVYLMFLYIVVFGVFGIYCLVLNIIHKEKNCFFSIWLILVAVIIALGMYCYFTRNTTAIVIESITILISIAVLVCSSKSFRRE